MNVELRASPFWKFGRTIFDPQISKTLYYLDSRGSKYTETGLTVVAKAKPSCYSSALAIFVAHCGTLQTTPTQLWEVIKMGLIKFQGHVYPKLHKAVLFVNESIG